MVRARVRKLCIIYQDVSVRVRVRVRGKVRLRVALVQVLGVLLEIHLALPLDTNQQATGGESERLGLRN